MYNDLHTWYNVIRKTYPEDIMNNLQTGQFIKQLRKEKGMTQRELAEKLNVSEKTVSKWETGNGLPDTGIMLPLSKVLGITVNELLAGQRLDSVNYADSAEENIKMFLQDKVSGRAKSLTALISSVLIIISSLALIVICAGYAQVEIWLRITLIIIGFFNIFAFTALVCILGASSEIFECSECGKKFAPELKAYIFGAHTFNKRRLKCPHCGKKSWCRSFWRN